MAAALAFDGFDRPALAEAEGGVDDTETMEAKPAQKTSEVFLHLTIATGRFTEPELDTGIQLGSTEVEPSTARLAEIPPLIDRLWPHNLPL